MIDASRLGVLPALVGGGSIWGAAARLSCAPFAVIGTLPALERETATLRFEPAGGGDRGTHAARVLGGPAPASIPACVREAMRRHRGVFPVSSPIASPRRQQRSGAPFCSAMRLAAACATAYLVGSIPVANLVARARGGPDLRADGGTVSGSALYARHGFGALALAGCAELAKGAYGPLAAGGPLPGRALAAAAAIVGHNWSPWLGFSGGRGVSLVLGAGVACAPEVTAVVGLCLGAGRLARQSGLGTFVGLAAVPLACAWRNHGALAGALVIAPVLAKRLMGNDTALPPNRAVAISRLLADRDDWPIALKRVGK